MNGENAAPIGYKSSFGLQDLLSDHRQVLESLGALRTENEILLVILKEHGINEYEVL